MDPRQKSPSCQVSSSDLISIPQCITQSSCGWLCYVLAAADHRGADSSHCRNLQSCPGCGCENHHGCKWRLHRGDPAHRGNTRQQRVSPAASPSMICTRAVDQAGRRSCIPGCLPPRIPTLVAFSYIQSCTTSKGVEHAAALSQWADQQSSYRCAPFPWACRYLYCFTVPGYTDIGSMKLTVFPGDLQGKTLDQVICPFYPLSLSQFLQAECHRLLYRIIQSGSCLVESV